MIVSPLDYELYSRVTGQPIPMSAAERMKMAPVVNEFTKNYTKAQNRQSLGRNILKIGALGALGAAAYYGSRDFGTPSQETGQNLVETSTASNLIQKAADNAAASTATNTISQSLSTDQTPEQTLENAAETTTKPSQLNINAALEKEDAPLMDAAGIREKYSPYTRKTSPEDRQERNLATMVGGGEILLDVPKKKAEVVKTKETPSFDAKGKSLLGKYVGMMTEDETKVDPTLKELSGQTTDTYGTELLVDDSFGSPLNDHPDVAGGEDDIKLPGGMNTSPTTSLAYVDPKRVMAMSMAISKGDIKQPLTPEEKLVVAAEVEKKRTPNPLEQRAIDNKTAMDSMRLSDEEREKESIRLGSTGGIPNKTDMAKIRKSPEFKAAQESMKPESTGEKVNGFLKNFPAQSVIRYGQMGGKASGIELNPSPNGEPTIGFAISDPKTQKTTKYSYPANKEVIQELSQDPDDPETSDESMGRKKFNYLLGLAKRGEKGIGERTKKEEFDTFVDTSKLEM